MNPIHPSSTAHQLVSIPETKQVIDDFLHDYFEKKTAEALQISPAYGDLWKAIAQLSNAGGKRLRPYITLLAFQAFSSDRPVVDILPAAAAQELLHLAMLIHDDIIDRDDIRYGVKNITGQYNELYRGLVENSDERLHFSNSAAILAGDLLISQSHLLIQDAKVDGQHLARAQAVLSEAIFRVAGGELLDTESAFRPFNEVSALVIAKQKTASYSFVSPLTMGAHLADASAEQIQNLTHFGHALGVAYQLQDDILGVFGDEEQTGKSTSGDIREGKHTHLVEQFYRLATQEQKDKFLQIFKHQEATPEQINRARQLFIESGAKDAVTAAITEFASAADQYLSLLNLRPEHVAAFTELVDRCIRRDK